MLSAALHKRGGPYKTCCFTTAVHGPGNPNQGQREFKLKNGGKHTFGNPFTWADISVSMDFDQSCPTCAPVAITHLVADLHAKKTWGEVGSDVGTSFMSSCIRLS